MAKKYKCPYCENRYERKNLVSHIDNKHEEMIPDGYQSSQIVYDLVNHTNGAGKCRVCGNPTKWNTKAGRYDVLCGNPKCKEYMREEYKKNMLKVHGTYNILTSDEQQKKMLANRSISGKYKFTDGGVLTYTGSYERKCLEFMDKVMEIPSKDILAPGPTLEYEMNGEKHFYITDFLYIPYNLIIEVKDGGDNPNKKVSTGMTSSRDRTIEKERLITSQGKYNYIRLTNNQFVQLIEVFMDIKKALIEGNDDKIIRVNESSIYNLLESNFNENYKPKGHKKLSQFKKVHITESLINNYKSIHPILKHVRYKDTNTYKCDGYMWLSDNDELVATVASCEYLDDHTVWMVFLEVTDKFRGYGLSNQVIDFAVKNMKCKYLSVNKNNVIAKKIYDKYGFKVYTQSNTMYFMTIDNIHLNKISESTEVDLYFVSDNPNLRILSPRVPDNFLTRKGYEDNKTKRVCLSTSIDGCLMALSSNLDGKELYVYKAIGVNNIYHPSIEEVPDCKITGEVWSKYQTQISIIGKILCHDNGKSGKKYRYGGKYEAELCSWDYEWVEKYN